MVKKYDVAFFILIKIIGKLPGKYKTLQDVLLKENYHLFWSGKINSASHHSAVDYFSITSCSIIFYYLYNRLFSHYLGNRHLYNNMVINIVYCENMVKCLLFC